MARAKEDSLERVARLRYWRAADAGVVVEAWRRSGETKASFCRRHGIEARRLSRWAAELEREGEVEGERVRFHPVQLVGRGDVEGRASRPIEIMTRGGHRVRVPAGFVTDDLARVLSVLGEGAAC